MWEKRGSQGTRILRGWGGGGRRYSMKGRQGSDHTRGLGRRLNLDFVLFFSITEKPLPDFKGRRALRRVCGARAEERSCALRNYCVRWREGKDGRTRVAAGCLLGASEDRLAAAYKGPLFPPHNLLVILQVSPQISLTLSYPEKKQTLPTAASEQPAHLSQCVTRYLYAWVLLLLH